MMIGYGRTSTTEQEAGLQAQVRDLQAAGCTKVFTEQASAVSRRPELEQALEFAREGDTFMVTKPDRLARSVADLLSIVGRLEAKCVALVILSMGGQRVDTGSPTGRLMLTMLGAVATFERDLMLERQREGIAKAKEDGKYRGRAPTARRKADQVIALARQGMSASKIAAEVGVSRASVYRIVNAAGIAPQAAPAPGQEAA